MAISGISVSPLGAVDLAFAVKCSVTREDRFSVKGLYAVRIFKKLIFLFHFRNVHIFKFIHTKFYVDPKNILGVTRTFVKTPRSV